METETPSAGRKVTGWLLGALGVAVVGLVAFQMWPEGSATSAAQPASRRTGTAGTAAAEQIDPAELKIRLEALQAKRPAQGEHARNPFRFQPPPAPPPPKPPPMQAAVPVGPPQPPPPPAIPPIPLKFMGTVEKPGLILAALTDCKGFSYAAREGEAIEGKYRLVKINVESVILEYSNGTGRTTVRKSGDCPK
jgi:hypothetical protein